MESDFDLDIEPSLFAAALSISFILLCITLCYYQYVAAGNHKHGFLCEEQGFLWSYMGFYVVSGPIRLHHLLQV